jgi:hypothetical protein
LAQTHTSSRFLIYAPRWPSRCKVGLQIYLNPIINGDYLA